ncbi:MAG: hypothetical protein WC829_10525 [Hyphomicrobium sp.]|jgi:hypothetical protein
MKAHASARLLGMLMVLGTAPMAGAMELSQSSTQGSDAQSSFSLPIFLDGTRLSVFQEAWQAHFAGVVTAAPARSDEAEAAAIEDARRALTRAEEIDREAAAVRERAEELSRRFGAEPASATNSDTASAPSGVSATIETAAIDAAPANGEAPVAELVSVSATVDDMAPSPEPAGSSVVETSQADNAPVIEEMATKPARVAKRVVGSSGSRTSLQTASNSGPMSGEFLVVDPAAPQPQSTSMMPTELRAFGWSSQP